MINELFVGSLIGIVLGLTGAGGSVIAIPLLMFVVGLSQTNAVGISLGTVFAATLLASIYKIRARAIVWLPAILFASSGFLVAPVGVYLGTLIPESLHLISFALLMFVIAVRMLWQSIRQPEQTTEVRAGSNIPRQPGAPICRRNGLGQFKIEAPCTFMLLLSGIVTGLLAGIYGVGGGFLIVPALMFTVGLDIRSAVATSLFVIATISLSGFATFVWNNLSNTDFPVSTLTTTICGALFGIFLGVKLSHRLSGPRLQQTFAIAVIGISLYILFR